MNPRIQDVFGTSAAGAEHYKGCRQFLILYLRNQEFMYVAYMDAGKVFAKWLIPDVDILPVRAYNEWTSPVICGRCKAVLGSCYGGAIKEVCGICRERSSERSICSYEIQRLAELLRVPVDLCILLIIEVLQEIRDWDGNSSKHSRNTEEALAL